ncbi:MAG TPA: hypothetical protein VFV01_11295 [Spirillospora sp.]|nr:hypothetical protein [Spirillospora sp.]
MAGAHAGGVTARVVDDLTVRLSLKPKKDRSFRIVTGVPRLYRRRPGQGRRRGARGGVGGAQKTEAYWHRFWKGAAPMRTSSPDGTGEYMEQLRAQQLYMTAAPMRSAVPSSHGGVINMFSPWQDAVHWSADQWWHLRQPVYTNLGADTKEYNIPYFRLYLDRLKEMRYWTKAHWAGAEGACVAEFLRYDGTAEACDGERPPDRRRSGRTGRAWSGSGQAGVARPSPLAAPVTRIRRPVRASSTIALTPSID